MIVKKPLIFWNCIFYNIPIDLVLAVKYFKSANIIQ